MNSNKLRYTLMDKKIKVTYKINLNNYEIQIDGHCVNDIKYHATDNNKWTIFMPNNHFKKHENQVISNLYGFFKFHD